LILIAIHVLMVSVEILISLDKPPPQASESIISELNYFF
jgi:hypothetical protein